MMTKTTRLLDLVNAVDNVPLDFDFASLYKLLLPQDSRPHGFLTPETVSEMPWTASFKIDHTARTVQILETTKDKDLSTVTNEALQSVVDAALAKSLTTQTAPDGTQSSPFPMLRGLHSEKFRIIGANYFACIERFPVPLFGVCGRGAHLTAYVRDATSRKIKGIWVAKRAAHLFTYPGMLDTSVAGGVKADDSPLDCIIAEADEEASIPKDYVEANVVAAGAVTYVGRRKQGLISPTVLYVYDLELPEDGPASQPVPNDDEVESFELWDVDKVWDAMLIGKFKLNCNLVMIDFFIRHGIITEANEPDYLEILSRLTRKLPVPTAPELVS